MKFPFAGRGSRSPLHFPLFPLSGQRRWSEAAAGEVTGDFNTSSSHLLYNILKIGDTGDSSMRRWSMPWDSARIEGASGGGGPWRYIPSKLAVPPPVTTASQSTTPEAISQPATIPTAEGLAEAIQLLSCRPMRCSVPNTSTHGGVIVGGSGGGGGSIWPDRRVFPGMSSQRFES